MDTTIAMPGVASVNVAPLPGQNGGASGTEVAVPVPTQATTPEPIPLPGSKQLVRMEEQVRQETSVPDELNPDQSRDKVARYLEQMNKSAETLKLGMRFGIFEDSSQLYVQLVDTRT
ncbi:MAG: flagellar protein FlaG, partial [Planctomycetota bacterium]|nr:flagellar protein FlaG [Planctomycetota bacterium]